MTRPATILLIALLSPAIASADPPASSEVPTAVTAAPIVTPLPEVTMPPATPAVPIVPKFADVASCYVAAQPGVLGQCVADPGKVQPLDSRSFWMSFGIGLGSTFLTLGTTLLIYYLPPTH